MDSKLEHAVSVTTTASYSLSGTLVLGNYLSVLDQHAAAFGVIIGFMTFVTNLVFNMLRYKAIRSGKYERRSSNVNE